MDEIDWSDFERVKILAGTIVEAVEFPQARKPAYKLKIDLGEELGIKKSSAQITEQYRPEELRGKQVLCVVNFPPKQVGPFISEVLTTGLINEGGVVLAVPDKKVKNGLKLS